MYAMRRTTWGSVHETREDATSRGSWLDGAGHGNQAALELLTGGPEPMAQEGALERPDPLVEHEDGSMELRFHTAKTVPYGTQQNGDGPDARDRRHPSQFDRREEANDPSGKNACGTTVLASILRDLDPGFTQSRGDIDREIRDPNAVLDLGTSPEDLMEYAEDRGFEAHFKSDASVDDILACLVQGVPVQVLLDPGKKTDFTHHYVRIEGVRFDGSGQVTHLRVIDPVGGQEIEVTRAQFEEKWSDLHVLGLPTGTNRVMLSFLPEEGEITGLDGVTRDVRDLELREDSFWKQLGGDAVVGRVTSQGAGDLMNGLSHLDMGQVLLQAVPKLVVGTVVGEVVGQLIGGSVEDLGALLVDYGTSALSEDGLLNKASGVVAVGVGTIVKTTGTIVRTAANVITKATDLVVDAVASVGSWIKGLFSGG